MAVNTTEIKTYNDIWTFTPRRIAECRSIDDVRRAVVAAVSEGSRIRPMGAGCSWAPHVATSDVCLKLSGLNRIHAIDAKRKTIRVEAGTRLGDMTRALAAHGLALPSLSFFPEVTVGGAVATATHGTSLKWGSLSDFVLSMTIVLASGDVKVLGPDAPPDELLAARTAIGTLGAIVELELQAVDIPFVRFTELKLDLATFRTQLPSILAHYDHVWAHWTLGADSVRVECLESRTAAAKGFHRYIDDWNCAWRPPSSLAKRLLRPLVHRARGMLSPAPMPSQSPQVWMSMQYGVPLAQRDSTIDLIRTSAFATAFPGRIVEMKFLKGETSSSYLGPNADGDAILFNTWWLVDEAIKMHVFDAFETTMQSLHARPHWGKQHRPPDIAYMRRAYPRWESFEAVRARLDPGETFSMFPLRVASAV